MINRAIKDGAKEAMILTVSAALSGTNQSAQQAKEMVDIPVTVYDSKSAGMGLGWQVLAAARARDAGGDINASVEAARKTREHLVLLLMVETLEYLHKGGRIGGAQKLIGTALNLKPRLRVNHETGIIEPVERTRTRAKAIEGIYQSFFKEMDTSRPLHVAIHHAAAERDAALLRDRVENEYHPVELIMNELTPVIGTHVGPGLLGITGYYE
jgi:DegV family protein with EDD domain